MADRGIIGDIFAAREKKQEEEKQRAADFKRLVAEVDAAGILNKDQAITMDYDTLKGTRDGAIFKQKLGEYQAAKQAQEESARALAEERASRMQSAQAMQNDFSGYVRELPTASRMAPADPRLSDYYEADANEMPSPPQRGFGEYMPELAGRYPMAPQHPSFDNYMKLLQTPGANGDNLPPEQVLIGDKGAEVPYVWKRGSREFQPRADVMLKGRSDLSAQRFDEQGRLIEQRGQVQGDLQDTRLKTQRELQAERLAAQAEARASSEAAHTALLERRHELSGEVTLSKDPVTGKLMPKGSAAKVQAWEDTNNRLDLVNKLKAAKKEGKSKVRFKGDGSIDKFDPFSSKDTETIDDAITRIVDEAPEMSAGTGAASPPSANAGKAVGGYKIGTIYGGLRYKGGDPNQQANWEKAR